MNSPTIYVCTNGRAIYDATAGAGGFEPCPEYLRGFTLDPGHCAVCLQDLTPIPHGEQTTTPLVTIAQVMPIVNAAAAILDFRRIGSDQREADWSRLRELLRPWRTFGTAPRVFTEDEVRPLWEALRAISDVQCECTGFYQCNGCEKRGPALADPALDAFPASEQWTR